MENSLILIVEDHPTVSLVFSQALRNSPFAVEIVPNGRMALERLQETVPNLLLLDLHLPEISGLDILQQLREDKRFQQTKIVLMTADILAYDRLAQSDEEIYLKPISIHTLRELVDGLKVNPK